MNKKQIELLNKIIDEAIEHGGGPGGPYFCNEEGLRTALQRFIDENDLSGQYRISSDSDMMKIVGVDET